MPATAAAWVDLYWLPLGAGGHFVRLNGRIYEAVAARLERRPACDLYHSALELGLPEGRFVVEQAPVPDRPARRGGGSSRKGAVGRGGRGGCGSSATRCGAGATASCPMWPRPSPVRGG